jgi:hypothetical protein
VAEDTRQYARLQRVSYVQQVIGLHGKAGSGKNYIAETIIQPLGFAPFAYAFALKNFAVGKKLATYTQVYRGKGDPAVRHLLQQEGTERGRKVYGDDVWVLTTLAWMETLAELWGVQNFVVTDVRFPNEVKLIQDLGGRVYHIEAPSRTDQTGGMDTTARQHSSEVSLDEFAGFDGVINNDVGVDDLEEQVLGLMLRDGLWNPMDAIVSGSTMSGSQTEDGESPSDTTTTSDAAQYADAGPRR